MGFAAANAFPVAAVFVIAGLVGLLCRGLGLSLAASLVSLLVVGQLTIGALMVGGVLPNGVAVVFDVIVMSLAAVSLRNRRRLDRRTYAAAWCFVAFSIVQVFNPLLPSYAYGFTGLRSISLPVVVFWACATCRVTSRDVRVIVGALLIGWTINGAIAARQWTIGFTPAELAWLKEIGSSYIVGNQIRLLGALRSGQDFGYAAAISVPALVTLGLASRKPYLRAVSFSLAGISVVLLMATLLRSALLGGLSGGFAVLALATATDRRRLILAAIVTCAGLFSLVAAAPNSFVPSEKVSAIGSRAVSIFEPFRQASFQTRQTETYPEALASLARHPLGSGVGSTGPVAQGGAIRGSTTIRAPDNGYLLIAIQLGLPGLLLFIWLLAAIARSLQDRIREGSYFAIAGLGCTVSLIVAMLLGSYWSLLAPATIWAVIAGLGANPTVKR